MKTMSTTTETQPLKQHRNGQWCVWEKGHGYRFFGTNLEAAIEKHKARASQPPATKVQETSRADKGSPKPPYDGFPLYWHKGGQWAKSIRLPSGKRKTHYFGSDWREALDQYRKLMEAIAAGRETTDEGMTVDELTGRFLDAKQAMVETGEINQRTYADYRDAATGMAQVFSRTRPIKSLGPPDFERLRNWWAKDKEHGVDRLTKEISLAKAIVRYAEELTDYRIKVGSGFKPPSKLVKRKARQARTEKHGPRMFEAADLRRILEACPLHLRAMVYLGLNCGLGNNDCAKLHMNALQLDAGWLNFPRPKTAIHRHVPLWPETTAALREAISARPSPKNPDHADRVFITKYGNTWEPKSETDNPVSNEMGKLLKKLDLKRQGLNFYALRHTFQTIGDRTLDKDAVRAIMGHVENANDMSVHYREEGVSDERLLRVTNYVRDWLLKSDG